MAKQDRYSSMSPRNDEGDREDFKRTQGASEHEADREAMGDYPESDEELPRVGGLGKEIKIGLTVITILLVVLGAVVAVRLRGPSGEPAADAQGQQAAQEPAPAGSTAKTLEEVTATPSQRSPARSSRPALEDWDRKLLSEGASGRDERGPKGPSLFDDPRTLTQDSDPFPTRRTPGAGGRSTALAPPPNGSLPGIGRAGEERRPLAAPHASTTEVTASGNPLRQGELPDPPPVARPASPPFSTTASGVGGSPIATRQPAGAAAATPRGADLSGGLTSLSHQGELDRNPDPVRPPATPWRDRAADPLPSSTGTAQLPGTTDVLPPRTSRSSRDLDAGRRADGSGPVTPSRTAEERIYVVREGDTLYDIARIELGRGGRWAEIYERNRDTVRNQFDALTPGTKLVLPGGGAGAGGITRRPGSGFNR